MTIQKRPPFPLQWPEGVPRARWHETPRFSAGSFTNVRDTIVRWLERRGRWIVITSNLPTRGDGLPYAAANVSEPGIAVWWVEKGKEHVIACDRWRNAPLNLRAILMTLDAIRGIERWGTSQMVERAFAGFAALPAGDGSEVAPPPPRPPRTWREVLGLTADVYRQLVNVEQLVIAKARHRELIRAAHPDAGGDNAIAAELNAAIEAAEQELTR